VSDKDWKFDKLLKGVELDFRVAKERELLLRAISPSNLAVADSRVPGRQRLDDKKSQTGSSRRFKLPRRKLL